MNKYIAIIFIALIATSFFIGRSTVGVSEKIKFIRGETIYETIVKDSLVYTESTPDKPTLPMKPITTSKDSSEHKAFVVDTAKIIQNYIIKKSYVVNGFDNNNGKLVIKPVIQYNELQSVGIEFTPITKEVTKTIERVFIPFVQASYNSFGYVEAGGGIYYHNIGLQANYITNFKDKGFSVGVNVKF
jgi:hypothetical protein